MRSTTSNVKVQSFGLALTLLVSILAISCNEAEKPATVVEETKPVFSLDSARKEIEDINRVFMDYVAKGDSVAIGNLYTQDAKVMFAGNPTAVGRSSIQSLFGGMLKSGITKADLKIIALFGNDDLLVEEGEVTVYVKDKVAGVDRYLVAWKKEDGKWKLFRDIANSASK